jgi:nitrite reductase/ring-hydroxylating ferredoxin subunit
MLRAEDNRFLTESGAGTPMGELLRRFWLPVLLSQELPEADCPPKKIVVMGEELLAFRDTRGVVGIIDQHCPHRGANLWLGRVEECGIRCVYHGWKFDTDGACVDMPTSYPDLDAKNLIRIKSYPVREWVHRHRTFHLRASKLRQGRGRNPRYQEALHQSARPHEHRSHALDCRGSSARHQDPAA